MVSRSPSRGRSRTRSHTPTSVDRAPSPARRSPSPRSRSRTKTRSLSRSPPTRDPPNGNRGRTRTRSPTRSRSPSAGERRSYRDRSYTRRHSRSLSRDAPRVQSSKIVIEKLTKNVTEGHLREIFGSYGQISSIDLPLNKQCEYECRRFAKRALLTDHSHDEPRDGIYPVQPSVRVRVSHSSHARGAIGRSGDSSQHCFTTSGILSVTATS